MPAVAATTTTAAGQCQKTTDHPQIQTTPVQKEAGKPDSSTVQEVTARHYSRYVLKR